MLILTRKLGENIRIGDNIRIVILDIKGSQVKLGIDAPANVSVHREEIYERIREENRRAGSSISARAIREVAQIFQRGRQPPRRSDPDGPRSWDRDSDVEKPDRSADA